MKERNVCMYIRGTPCEYSLHLSLSLSLPISLSLSLSSLSLSIISLYLSIALSHTHCFLLCAFHKYKMTNRFLNKYADLNSVLHYSYCPSGLTTCICICYIILYADSHAYLMWNNAAVCAIPWRRPTCNCSRNMSHLNR